VSYTQKDKDFINTKWSQKWNSFREDWNRWENHTLADYIKEFAEIAALKIDADLIGIKKQEISSYLVSELIRDGRRVTPRYVQEVLPSHYKRNYSQSELSSQLEEQNWNVVATSDTDVFEKDQFNNYKINNEMVTIVKHQRPEPSDKPQPTQVKLNDTTKSIFALEQCGSLLERIANYMRTNYVENKEILDKAFKDKSLFYLDYYAILTNARKEIDERNKWGDFEKIGAKFLIDTGESTARIAELLNYSSKYGSIGIDRHGEFVDPQTKEFKRKMLEFLMKCPSCNNNIYHIINENIEKHPKGKELEIELPL